MLLSPLADLIYLQGTYCSKICVFTSFDCIDSIHIIYISKDYYQYRYK